MRKRTKAPTIRKDTVRKNRVPKPKKEKIQRVKAPKTRNNNTMSEQEFFNRIGFILRNGFRWWKPMYEALNDASRPSQSKNKLLKKEFQCANCKSWHPRTGVQIDHIVPVGQLRSFDDLVPFMKNLTQEDSRSYQILCKPCHKVKTKKENEQRKLQRKQELLNNKKQ